MYYLPQCQCGVSRIPVLWYNKDKEIGWTFWERKINENYGNLICSEWHLYTL